MHTYLYYQPAILDIAGFLGNFGDYHCLIPTVISGNLILFQNAMSYINHECYMVIAGRALNILYLSALPPISLSF